MQPVRSRHVDKPVNLHELKTMLLLVAACKLVLQANGFDVRMNRLPL